MNLSSTDLNLFKVFDIIYQEGSITKAAQTLGITQPAVSNSLSRLRVLFDDELFIRSNRGMRPTPMAHNIHPSVSSALALLRSSINEGAIFEPTTSNITFNVCMNATAQVAIIPSLVSYLQTNTPNVKLCSHTIFSKDIIQALSNETIDLAITYGIPSPDHIKRELLFDDDYVCIVRKDHPRIKDTLTIKQFEAEQHLLLEEEAQENSNLRSALAEKNIIQNSIFIGNEHVALPPILMKSNAIMTTTRALANAMSNYLNVRLIDPPFNIASKKTFLYWHKDANDSEANKWLRSQILSAIKK